MKKFLEEFKSFALKGNVMDLAVGVIIGAAFGNVVSSLTDNILSPIIGLFTGENFDAWHIEVLGVDIQYGAFITAVINFVIMALVVFLLMKGMNALTNLGRHKKEDAPTTKKCPFCKTDIDVDATRCPACTSQLNATAPAEG